MYLVGPGPGPPELPLLEAAGVVRLKAGGPLLFAHAQEEPDALRAAGRRPVTMCVGEVFALRAADSVPIYPTTLQRAAP